jgi:hypothetical protein
MTSESSPSVALDRLREAAFDGADECHINDYHRFPGCCFRGAYIDAAIAAVLPALADELEREAKLRQRGDGLMYRGWRESANYLRSLAAPADEPKL